MACFVLGNPRVLSEDLIWLCLITNFREMGSLVQGDLNSLEPSTIRLQSLRERPLPPPTLIQNNRDFSSLEDMYNLKHQTSA